MKKYLVISFFLFLSCKKDHSRFNVPCNAPTSDIQISKELIIGRWEWVSELYSVPFSGQLFLKTPQTEGYTRKLVAYSNRLEFFRNNSFEQKFKYDLVMESTITNYVGDSSSVLVFKDFDTGVRTNHTHFKICNDTLTLNFQILSSFKGIEKWAKSK